MSTLVPCQAEPDLWFSSASADQRRAIAGCRRCPLIESCAQTALDEGRRYGVWGGLTEKARRKLKASSGKQEPNDCGTDRALRVHRNRREKCDVCQEAHAARLLAGRRQRLTDIHAAGGSVAGAAIHRRIGEPVCPLCLEAQARDSVNARERWKTQGVTPRKRAACGTPAGHSGHRRRGEQCEPCRLAYNAARREYQKQRATAAVFATAGWTITPAQENP